MHKDVLHDKSQTF